MPRLYFFNFKINKKSNTSFTK